jgi:hypothetical protein
MESDPFFEELLESFRESVNAESTSLLMLDESSQNLVWVAGVGYPPSIDPKSIVIPIKSPTEGKGLTGHIAFVEQRAWVSNTSQGKEEKDRFHYVMSLLVVPLKTKEGNSTGS